MKKSSLFIIVVSIVGIISAFLPWVAGSAYGIDISVTGMEVGAILSIIFYAIAIVVAIIPKIKGKGQNLTTLIVGLLGTAFILFKMFSGDSEGVTITYHYGIYLALITSILLFVIGIFAKKIDGGSNY